MFDFINKPLGWVLENLADIFSGNFAIAVFAFTVLINVLLIPLNVKSQKSSVQQTRIKPKLDELKKRCGDDRQKFATESQKLYADEGVSMSPGCLPMLLRLVLMLCIYTVILSPLTYMSGVEKTHITNVTETVSKRLSDIKKEDKEKHKEYTELLNWKEGRSQELSIVGIIRNDEDVLKEVLTEKQYKKIKDDLSEIKAKDKESAINYTFITEKINLTETPKFSLDIFHEAQLIWIMPLLAFAAQMISGFFSMKMQKKINPDAPNMAAMMFGMPIFSLFIGFGFPAGVTFYWACSSLIGGIIQLGVQYFYGPHKMLSRERAKELAKQCDFEATQLKKFGN
ncbi:MAG: YidC/Oxa1 family membrane protein insertase [Ruminococcaceae bacterium]|nr:YidC/Oxa1 family membrane protein insertase [Oscillospiraceae bacterium]